MDNEQTPLSDSESGAPVEDTGDHWLYRCFDASGTLLYVGITSTGIRRFRKHGNDKTWWAAVANIAVEHHADQGSAHAAEIRAIEREQPLHNIDYNRRRDEITAIWRRCDCCKQHYRPPAGFKKKRTCPSCIESGARRRGGRTA